MLSLRDIIMLINYRITKIRGEAKMKNQNGLTLIELILAIAILAIVMVALLTLFGSGYKSIINAGNRTESLYSTSNSIETNLLIKSTTSVVPITLTFDNGTPLNPLDDLSFTVQGEVLQETVPINGKQATIYYFNPN